MNLTPKRLLVALLLALTGLSAAAQINLSAPVPADPAVKMGKLPNGLTYYIRKNAKPEKKVELRLAINAGSILEDADQRGLAHFMEHMNFNGSRNFPKNELVDYLQKVGVKFGADLNAYTSFDETVYMLPISSDNPETLEKGFLVLEDWAFNNLLDKKEIEKERGVVLEESRLSKGAQARMMRKYFPKLFNGSKYAERLPIGTDSILKNFKPATLERFYRTWYRPNLMAVIVVGDIDPAEMEKKIVAHFGKYKNPAAARPRPAITPIAPRLKPEAVVVTDEEQTNTMIQMFTNVRPAKPVKTWGDYRKELADELVNTLINQRLEELTQKENPPFVFAFTGQESFIRGHEAFISVAMLGDNKPKEALDALVAETERARQFGFLPSEIERAKKTILNNADRSVKEKDKLPSARLVQEYVSHFLQADPMPSVDEYFKFVSQVLPTISVAEVNGIAKAMPATNNSFALLMAPEKKKGDLPSNAALLKDVVAASNQKVKAYEEKAVAASLMEGGPGTAGKITAETKNARLNTTTFTLSNGIKVTVKPTSFNNDEIVMDAWRHGGAHRFPVEDKNMAMGISQLIPEMGVKDMSGNDLKKFLAGKTVEATPYMNEHEEGIQGSSSVKDFETMLQLVNLYMTQPRKDESVFKSNITKTKGMLMFAKGNPQFFFQDTLTKITYNNNPWMQMIPTAEQLDNMNLDRIMAIYKDVFGNADGLHFFFVGNIDVEKSRPLFEQYLGSLPATPVEHKFKDNNIRPAKGVVEANIKKGKDAKSLVTIMWHGETSYDPQERLAFRALLDALNITIIEKLREELGGMYSGGLNGSITKRPYVHYTINAYVPTGPENVDKLTKALFEIISKAKENGVPQKDLDKVKETMKKGYRTQSQENEYWLDVLSQAFINDTDPELALDYEKRVDALTIEDLKKAAQKYFDMQNYIKAVLYPESANVETGVKKSF